ncbi:MAG: sugar phosphate isomerase/epimerase [Pseudomonadota bacterium]
MKWAYALNQWKPTYDSFARREQYERALKTVSVCGFRAVELNCGSGRWEPVGNREMLQANHGSLRGFRDFLHSCGIDAVSSYFLDPGTFQSSTDGMPLSAANPRHCQAIVTLAREYLEMLPELGGTRLVVRPAPSYWQIGTLAAEVLEYVAECWNAVAALAASNGVQVSLHVDCLSSIRTEETIEQVLQRTNPVSVGLTIDTAEQTIAGLDPLAVYERFSSRVNHVQFKDVVLRDERGEALEKNAEMRFLSGGGSRNVPRWFWEMGTPGGLVNFAALKSRMEARGYSGWTVIESDQSPYPATSAMLNSWYVKHVLG